MSKRASDDVLSLIHTITAQRLLDRLNDPAPLTPAEINAISKFLKDNEITASIEPGTPHANLTKAFDQLDAKAVGLFRVTGGEEDIENAEQHGR